MPFSTEKDLEYLCLNCGEEHEIKWESQWDEHSSFMHYKTGHCSSCGYKVHLRTEIDCSGH